MLRSTSSHPALLSSSRKHRCRTAKGPGQQPSVSAVGVLALLAHWQPTA